MCGRYVSSRRRLDLNRFHSWTRSPYRAAFRVPSRRGHRLGAENAPRRVRKASRLTRRTSDVVGQFFQELIDGLRMSEELRVACPVFVRPIRASCQSPNSSPHRSLMNQVLLGWAAEKCCRSTLANRLRRRAARCCRVLFKRLGIELLHHPEAAELALGPVPVAVMISVFGGELALGKIVDDFDT